MRRQRGHRSKWQAPHSSTPTFLSTPEVSARCPALQLRLLPLLPPSPRVCNSCCTARHATLSRQAWGWMRARAERDTDRVCHVRVTDCLGVADVCLCVQVKVRVHYTGLIGYISGNFSLLADRANFGKYFAKSVPAPSDKLMPKVSALAKFLLSRYEFSLGSLQGDEEVANSAQKSTALKWCM